jgi:hypothetical protein
MVWARLSLVNRLMDRNTANTRGFKIVREAEQGEISSWNTKVV